MPRRCVMPTIVMTPDEFAAMPWYARQKIVNQRLRAQRPGGVRVPTEARSVEWAREVREDAAALLSAMPPDPHASEHRAAVTAMTASQRRTTAHEGATQWMETCRCQP